MKITSKVKRRLRRAKSINAGGPLLDSDVTLAIYADDIDVAKLTSLLGRAPTCSIEKGEIRHPPHGSGPASIGFWFLEAPKSLSFEAKVQYLLKSTPGSAALWRRIAKSHRVELRCAVFMHSWNEGFELAADDVEAIGARRWKFSLGIYGAEGDEVLTAFLAKAPRRRAR